MKLNGIELKCYIKIINKDTLIIPKEIAFTISIINFDTDRMALLIGSTTSCFSKMKTKYGVFKVLSRENKEFELCCYRKDPFCIQYGDSLNLILYISDDDLSKFPFYNNKKDYKDYFNWLSLIYVSVPEDYPKIVGTTIFKTSEKIDISKFYVHLDINYPNEDKCLEYIELEVNH
jgi:hypothetical protein